MNEGGVLAIKQLPESERLQLRRILAEPAPSNAAFATLLHMIHWPFAHARPAENAH